MKIANVSRHYIQNLEQPHTNGQHWLISITTHKDQPVKPAQQYSQIYHFVFNDVNEPGPTSITETQAQEIAEIIKQAVVQKVDILLVHCDMGICRSGAVIEAALLNQNITYYSEISNKRQPNTLVFNLVRKALGYNYSWE